MVYKRKTLSLGVEYVVEDPADLRPVPVVGAEVREGGADVLGKLPLESRPGPDDQEEQGRAGARPRQKQEQVVVLDGPEVLEHAASRDLLEVRRGEETKHGRATREVLEPLQVRLRLHHVRKQRERRRDAAAAA